MAMYLVSCEHGHKNHQQKYNWKVSPRKGKYPVEHKDTTITYDHKGTYSPLLEIELKL